MRWEYCICPIPQISEMVSGFTAEAFLMTSDGLTRMADVDDLVAPDLKRRNVNHDQLRAKIVAHLERTGWEVVGLNESDLVFKRAIPEGGVK